MNYIKAIRHNPKRLPLFIVYIVYFAFIAWTNLRATQELNNELNSALITGCVMAYGAMILLTNLATSYNEMLTFFKPADIGIVFTSPLSPRAVMAAGLFKSSFGNMLLTLFLIIIGARVLIPTGSSMFSLLGVVLIVMLFNLVAQPLNFIVMRLKKHMNGMVVHVVVNLLWVVPLVVLLVINQFNLVALLMDPTIYYVPILGWMAGLALACYGSAISLWPLLLALYGGFIMGVLGLCLYLADDYYEEVSGGIEKFASLRQRDKEGKGNFSKIRKNRKNQGANASLNEESQNLDAQGQKMNAWYWRSVVTAQKRRRFRFIGIPELVMILGAVGATVATYFSSLNDIPIPYLYNGIVLYILFLFSVNGSQKMDFLTPKFIMSPGNPLSKLVSVVRLDFVKQLIAIFAVNAVLCFSKDVSILLLGLCALAQIIVYLEVLCTNLLVHIFLKNSTDVALVLPLLKVIQMLLIIVPTVAVSVWVLLFTQNLFWIISAIGAVQIAVVSLVMGLAAWQATRLEISQ